MSGEKRRGESKCVWLIDGPVLYNDDDYDDDVLTVLIIMYLVWTLNVDSISV